MYNNNSDLNLNQGQLFPHFQQNFENFENSIQQQIPQERGFQQQQNLQQQQQLQEDEESQQNQQIQQTQIKRYEKALKTLKLILAERVFISLTFDEDEFQSLTLTYLKYFLVTIICSTLFNMLLNFYYIIDLYVDVFIPITQKILSLKYSLIKEPELDIPIVFLCGVGYLDSIHFRQVFWNSRNKYFTSSQIQIIGAPLMEDQHFFVIFTMIFNLSMFFIFGIILFSLFLYLVVGPIVLLFYAFCKANTKKYKNMLQQPIYFTYKMKKNNESLQQRQEQLQVTILSTQKNEQMEKEAPNKNKLSKKQKRKCQQQNQNQKINQSNQIKDCAICLENFQKDQKLVIFPCHKTHVFHLNCSLKWFETKQICPICKAIYSLQFFEKIDKKKQSKISKICRNKYTDTFKVLIQNLYSGILEWVSYRFFSLIIIYMGH
ncbi:hypothetical protein PPERSA_11454 [Pseudocohnilembus persalinus]|uniref:RING-type domain-containing protein n=1 Tax=Pseudocohnilembus persalinus TaxID=266149 RepID=A0A0V0QWN5_PSEPJ|nr:hypothetical protein PPERSA_11454 [Pseudocohnilembus persalinus]|eukprot:KRX06809.1 hypothetical protein PPERSA_11454 [Pseudocohnilembus persalinus]